MASQTTPKNDDKAPPAETKPEQQQPAADKKPAALEEDDEFEDFPVDGGSPTSLSRFKKPRRVGSPRHHKKLC